MIEVIETELSLIRCLTLIASEGKRDTTGGVTHLAEIVAPRIQFNEDEVYEAMANAGIPGPVADRAYKFTQIAWGRVLLYGLQVRFSPEYTCFNGVGEVIETGRLANPAVLRRRSRLRSPLRWNPGLQAAVGTDGRQVARRQLNC